MPLQTLTGVNVCGGFTIFIVKFKIKNEQYERKSHVLTTHARDYCTSGHYVTSSTGNNAIAGFAKDKISSLVILNSISMWSVTVLDALCSTYLLVLHKRANAQYN